MTKCGHASKRHRTQESVAASPSVHAELAEAFNVALGKNASFEEFWAQVPTSASDIAAELWKRRHADTALDETFNLHLARYSRYDVNELGDTFLPTREVLQRRVETVWNRLPAHMRSALGASSAVLPLVIYCSDTAFMVELFARMKGLQSCAATPCAICAQLGPYVGLVNQLMAAVRAVRMTLGPEVAAMRIFLEESRQDPFGVPLLAARALWVARGEELDSLARFVNFASFALTIPGAAQVLSVYRGCTAKALSQPLFLLANPDHILGQGFPTYAFYPDSPHDSGAADAELEVMLPPFSALVVAGPSEVGLWPATAQQLLEKSRVAAVAQAWQISTNLVQRLLQQAVDILQLISHQGFLHCRRGHKTTWPQIGRPCCSKRYPRGSAEWTQSIGLTCVTCSATSCLICDPSRWLAPDKGQIDLRTARFIVIGGIKASWGS